MRESMFQYVLVMDDDLEWRDLLYNILTQLNYKVTTVPTSVELIETLKQERPNTIVINMDASDRSREVILKILREIDEKAKLVVLLSGSINEEVIKRLCLSDSRMTILRKDMPQPQLVQFIIKLLKEEPVQEADATVKYEGRILVVDDDERLARMVHSYLARKGYETYMALNGEEAILKIKSIKPRIVLLDILMPGMDGLIVLKHVKEIDSSIVAIVTSGVQQDDKLFQEAIRLGAATYLMKPYNLSQLESFILASILKEKKKDIM